MRYHPIALCGYATLFAGCMAPVDSGEPDLRQKADELWLASDQGGSLWPGGNVGVCFSSGSFSTATRTLIQNTLQQQGGWQPIANITFTGFETCASSSPGDSIVRVDQVASGSLGANVIGMSYDYGYNLGVQPWVKFVGDPIAGGAWIVLHEFGHILNFAHETSDTTCAQRTSGGTQLSSADATSSVMDWSNGCYTTAPTVISQKDAEGARKVYGPFTVPCPGGADSTCEDINFDSSLDLGALTGGGYPASSQYAMNGYGASYSTKASFIPHAGFWTVKFTGPKPIELPTDSATYDFTSFNTNQNIGCIALSGQTNQDSIAKRDLQHGGGCDVTSALGNGALNFSRYLSTHYNRDSQTKNAWTAWTSSPKDNQPITMRATLSGTTVYIDLIQVRVKYGRIDVWSDAATGDGVLGPTPNYTNLGPGTINLSPPLWSATKIVFTAKGSSPTAVSSTFSAAAIDGVIIGQP